jgi:DNA polymerase-3 subunit delta'
MSARPRRDATAAAPHAVRLGDVRGQERAIGFLRRAWERRRLAHALLFTGPAGVGKLATARALALGLHCDVAPFDACGTCDACRTIVAGTHPDVRVVMGPLPERRDIVIEQVRELQRELGFRAMSAHPKIGIVNDADYLTLQAQNALLKTLEEPGGDTVLVLVAVNASALAPTILSRCQRVTFDPLPTADVIAILETHGRGGPEARALAAYAEGSPGQALALDVEFFAHRRREILTRLAAAGRGGFKALADFAQELVSEDKDLVPALTVIASWYRDALRQRVLGADAELRNADLATDLPALSIAASLRNLEITYGTIVALRQNANRNLTLVRMLLQFAS